MVKKDLKKTKESMHLAQAAFFDRDPKAISLLQLSDDVLEVVGHLELAELPAEHDVQVRDALSRFDAFKARCFLSKDRHHLLAVMEAGFGDLQPFNPRDPSAPQRAHRQPWGAAMGP